MSRNGSGVYSLPAGNPVVTGTTISSSWANTTLSDIATALTGSVASDGQTAMTGNLQMGNNKVTGLAVATTSGDALSYAQAATVSDLAVTGNATVGGTLTLTGGLTLNGNVTVGDSSADTLTVNATSTFAAGATFSSTFAANGGVTLGDASGDALTINSSAVSIPNGLNFDSNTFVIDATNNRVGVGTASPSNTFVVGGSSPQIQVSGSGTSTDFRINAAYGAAAVAAVGTVGAHPMFFFTNNTERMRIDSSGNVGIGTSSPSYKLDVLTTDGTVGVASKAASGAIALIPYLDSTNGAKLAAYNNAISAFSHLTIDGTYLRFNTSNAERMRLDSSGNLGLGVTPSVWNSVYKALQISNSASFYARNNGTEGGFSANAFRDNVQGWQYINTAAAARYDQNAGQHLWFTAPSGTAGNAITFTQAMTLDASGRLGVGTTSPTTKLQVTGSIYSDNNGLNCFLLNSAGSYYGSIQNDAADKWSLGYAAASGSLGTPVLTWNSSGNVGIGTSSPASYGAARKALTINGTDGGLIDLQANGTRVGSFVSQVDAMDIYAITAVPLRFFTNSSERMRIDSSGNLLVGTTSALGGSQFKVGDGGTGNYTTGFVVLNGSNATNYGPVLRYYNNGSFMADAGDYASIVGSGTHQYAVRTGSSGGVYLASGATSWSAVSDETQKNIIEPITDGLNKVASLRSVIGSYKADETNTRHPFLIAQDVKAVLPEAVSENEHDGETVLGVAYTDVIPLLVAAIKELKAEVDSLKAQLNK